MDPRRTLLAFPALLAALPLLALAACGSGGGGGPPSGTSTCFYNTQGQVLSLTAAEIANVNAALALDGEAVVGIVIGASTLRMTIELTGPVPIAANEALVTQDLDTGVFFDKGIHAKNVCTGFESMLTKRFDVFGPVSMKIAKAVGSAGFDTLEFHKPGFLGLFTQIGEFLPSTFWALAQGRSVTFLWLTD